MERDAARYRWLRDESAPTMDPADNYKPYCARVDREAPGNELLYGAALDEAVDAAMPHARIAERRAQVVADAQATIDAHKVARLEALLRQAKEALTVFDTGAERHGMNWQRPILAAITAELRAPT